MSQESKKQSCLENAQNFDNKKCKVNEKLYKCSILVRVENQYVTLDKITIIKENGQEKTVLIPMVQVVYYLHMISVESVAEIILLPVHK